MAQMRYIANASNFSKIPGSPIAYWISKSMRDVFMHSIPLEKISYSFQGMITGNNDYFLRLWHEVDLYKTRIGLSNTQVDRVENAWVPYNKGGEYRKWYGNNSFLLRWEKMGKSLTRARTENYKYYFKEGVTWSFLASDNFSCRYFPNGYLWDVSGSSIFAVKNENIYYICALMTSRVAQTIFDIINPTLNYQVMNIIALPYISSNDNDKISVMSHDAVDVSKKDWDSFETSWNFKKHPLI